MDRFFGGFWGEMGLDRERFLDLGRFQYDWGPQFSMTVLALRTAGLANGVSRLHGEVSRRMWRNLWPESAEPEAPIDHVTNGIHTDTWAHPGLTALLDRYLGAEWRDAIDARATWAGVADIPGEALWAHHNRAKAEMIALVRERVARQLLRVGAPPSAVNAAAAALNPRALTIGFARRFATYKRATLLLRDQERLKRLLNDPERPVQFIFAGKAHPADEPGKAFIQTIYQLSRQPEYAGKILFVEDYDANIARHLVAGVDLWLNNPRRPLEASGTSGEKAGLNGVPNFSVLDGWWSEGYDGSNGWAIGAEREYATEAAQDEADGLSLYATLEDQIVPLFFALDAQGIPQGWLRVMRASIATIGPDYSFDRMLKEYFAKFYLPAAALGRQVGEGHFAGARELAGWEARVRAAWPQVVLSAEGPGRGEMTVGKPLVVRAALQAGGLAPDDLAVELVYGREAGGHLSDVAITPLRLQTGDQGVYHYEGAFDAAESGVFTYGVRVRPHHRYLPNPLAAYLMKWA
jgi:starch phosphorylase